MYSRATILALAAAAAAAPAPDAEPMHLPVARRGGLAPLEDGTVDFVGLLTEVNKTLAKYKANHRLHPLSFYLDDATVSDTLKKRAVSNERLQDQTQDAVDLAYYGVGSVSGQQFTIDFDTGSADLFIPGPNCTGCKGTPYDEKGVNQHRTTSVEYGSGEITGENYFDTVCVGGLCAPHTNLISLTSASGFSTLASSSLMGMGFETISESKEPTFFERLIALGKVTQNEFSFFLGRAKSKTGGLSQMTLGGVDKSKYTGEFTKHPVTKKGYWQLAIDGMTVGKRKSLLSSGQAAIDTGTTAIIAPTLAATALFLSIPGSVPLPLVATGSLSETAFAYPCSFKGPLNLVFGGKSYKINPLDLSIGSITPDLAGKLGLPIVSGLCAAAIIGADLIPGEKLYIVGDSFLKNWYARFNFDGPASVSFAAAKGNQ